MCLVQILGVAVWPVCRCRWRRSMMWGHWLQMLDDRCPGCTVLWLTRESINVALKCWRKSEQRVARGLDVTDASCRGCLIDVPVCSILG